jgi:predicted transcriptional regulator
VALFKTPEQVEFAALFEKLSAAGIKQTDVAEELHLSRPAISMYLKGGSNPSQRTLAGLRGMLERVEGDLARGTEIRRDRSSDKLHEQLDYLRQNDPPGYEAARTTVQVLYQKAIEKESPVANSGEPSLPKDKVDDIAKRALKRAHAKLPQSNKAA